MTTADSTPPGPPASGGTLSAPGFQMPWRSARPGKGTPATLGQRHIYILPTKYGLILACLLVLMLIGSLNYASNPGFLYTFLLAGAGLVALLHTWHNLLGLRVRGGRAEPVFAGQEAGFWIELENPRRRPRPGIEVSTRGATPQLIDLPSQGTARVPLRVPASRRGLLPLGRLTLSTRYPLGLLRAWAYVELPVQCLVYPKPAQAGELPPPAADGSQQGERGSGSEDFLGLRGYRPGDSPRQVFWKAAARGGELLTKEFAGGYAEQLWLDWDLLPALETEPRLSLLCRLVLLAAEQRRSYGLRLPDLELGPGQGEQHRQRCLAALARFRQ